MKKLLLCAGLGLSALCAQAQTKVKPATTTAAAAATTNQPAYTVSYALKSSYDVVGEVNNIQFEVYTATDLLTGAMRKSLRIEGYNQTSQTAANPFAHLSVTETDAFLRFLDAVIPDIAKPQKPNTVYSMNPLGNEFSFSVMMHGDQWQIMMSLVPTNRNATFILPADKLSEIRQYVASVKDKLALND